MCYVREIHSQAAKAALKLQLMARVATDGIGGSELSFKVLHSTQRSRRLYFDTSVDGMWTEPSYNDLTYQTAGKS